MRLIDADNLYRAITTRIEDCVDILEIIDAQPTIEAEPVRRGRWEECNSSDHWKCSECGDRAPMYWDSDRQEYSEWLSSFCPNCGAKMEEE